MNIRTLELAREIIEDIDVCAYVDFNKETIVCNSIDYMFIARSMAKSIGKCVFCGKSFGVGHLTVDHIIPQARGGITVIQNLYGCCRSCNNDKSFLTNSEYYIYRYLRDNVSEKEAQDFRNNVEKQMLRDKEQGKYKTNGWKIEMIPIEQIKVSENFKLTKRQEREVKACCNHFERFGYLRKPLVLSKNLALLESIVLYDIAVENNMEIVPVVILDYVECIDV